MEEIRDMEIIEYYLNREGIRDMFDSRDLLFQAYQYEKGDYIATPDKPVDKLLFPVEGSIQIYGIRRDGGISPVNHIESPCILGDLEFTNHGNSPFFVEAKTSLICLALSIREHREQLNRDVRFLHTLLRSYADKFDVIANMDIMSSSLEERVLFYMKHMAPKASLKGMEAACLQLRCSRRQLQRVLKKLCDCNKIEKIGKGSYRLC